MTQSNLAPSIFIGHGSPMLMIEDNPYSEKWRDYFSQLPKVKAIVSVSAHWVAKGVNLTTNNPQKQIYDFYGFPQVLYDIRLNIPGSPELARKVVHLLSNYEPCLTDEWGLDHGTWSVLYRIDEGFRVPVIQLSIDTNFSFKTHFEIARALRPLREQNILVLGSGNVVHNLRHRPPFTQDPAKIHEIAIAFQQKVIQYLNDKNINDLLDYLDGGAPEIFVSIGAKEHLIPLLYVLAQAKENEKFELFNQEFVGVALDMLCVAIR